MLVEGAAHDTPGCSTGVATGINMVAPEAAVDIAVVGDHIDIGCSVKVPNWSLLVT